MRNPKANWDKNLKNVKGMHWLYRSLSEKITAMDLSDILRSEYVLIVSAFDCYIHDVALYEMQAMFEGSKVSTDSFLQISIPISDLKQIVSSDTGIERNRLFSIALKKVLAKDSYQAPNNVESILSKANIKKLWPSIATKTGKSTEDVKTQLALIARRRNKIAHESDTKDSISTEKNEIDAADVELVFDFLNIVVETVEIIRSTP